MNDPRQARPDPVAAADSNADPESARPTDTRRMRRRAVINMRDARPVWEIPGWAREGIASSFPADWDVAFVESQADGRGDGGAVSPEALAAVNGAEVYIGLGVPRDLFLAATTPPANHLRWIHTGAAGVGSLLYPELADSGIVLTNSAGIHAPAIAETALAMMLHFARGLDFAVRAQADARWDPSPFETRVGDVTEIEGATIGIIGFGGIGQVVARKSLALGLNVLALRRSVRPGPDGVELFTGPGALERLLHQSDHVVVTVPATPSTKGMLGPSEIDAMRRGSVLINVARGEVVDEQALLAGLTTGKLRGAGLDVFATEPLPATSPLWTLPNVLITPHVSGTTPRFWLREVELIRDNIARYLAGRAMRNVVDKARGY
jgi:phosphoglycerate dehydrogenase-like enzyme